MQTLTQLFDELNQQFWNGRKPRYRVKYVTRVRFEDQHGLDGLCDWKRRTIYIRKGNEGHDLRRILLHEMCHIGCGWHGPKFQARLKYLADRGEDWALKEIEMWRTAPTRRQVVNEIKDRLYDMARFQPRPQFRQVVRYLSREYGTVKPLTWLKQTWRSFKAEVDQDKKLHEALLRRLADQQLDK